MTKEEFLDEVNEALIDIYEPSERGAGFAIGDAGQELLEELADKLFNTETVLERNNIMSTEHVVVEELAYRVSAVEKTQKLNDQGILIGIGRKWHANNKPIIALGKKAARSKIERSIIAKLEDPTDEQIDKLIDSLEVKVEAVDSVNFLD
jgi:hypothetical protein